MRWKFFSSIPVIGLFLVGLAGLTSISATPARASAAVSIRSVDFKNFTYDLGEGELVTVKNGYYSRNTPDDELTLQVLGVDYGDIDGNGAEDAAVWLSFNTGGTGNFSYTQAITMKNGQPDLTAVTGLGDRADGGLHDVLIDKGQLVEDRYTHGEGACCPDQITRFRFRLKGRNKLVASAKPIRRALITTPEDGSAVAVKFLRGTSAVTVYNFGTEPHLVTLSAKRAQTLIVKPVITSELVNESPLVVIVDGTTIATADGKKPVSLKLNDGRVTMQFTGEGYVDIAIR